MTSNPILDVSVGDQTMTITGDCLPAELDAALPAGLFSPIPPIELPGTVGELVKRGGFGQNFPFASEVLGLKFRAPSGRIIQAGGRTVKNVQGYDLTRLFVGSFGAMGEPLEITLRLRAGHVSQLFRVQGVLSDFPFVQARFIWQQEDIVYLFHFGHQSELDALMEQIPNLQPIVEMPDLKSLFSYGMGVGNDGPVSDLRMQRLSQTWVNGLEVPPVPELFRRVVEEL